MQFKYHGEWARAAHFGEPLATVSMDLQPIDLLVPVPLHPSRLRYRGFNQSLLLAQHVGAFLGVDVRDVLKRTRRTDAQVTLGAEQRQANVAGAFAARHDAAIAGLSIVLVDDVITTGATISACSEELRQVGAKSVRAVSIAREL